MNNILILSNYKVNKENDRWEKEEKSKRKKLQVLEKENLQWT